MGSSPENWGKVFRKREEIVSREIAGETILVPIKGKLADMQRIFTLDNVSEYIWQQLDGKRKVEDICDGVLEQYDIGKVQAEDDISEFIGALLKAELIVGVK